MAQNSYPRISIITPSFNQAAYLEQTIRSVLDQGYPNLEYIIMDGGSTDGSPDIIHRYSDRLKYWSSEPDSGQADAINKGAAHVTGDLVNWLNSDDYLEPGALKRIAESYVNNPDSAAFVFRQNVVAEDTATIDAKVTGTPLPDNFEKLLTDLRIDQPSTFFRGDAFRKLMPLNASYHYMMDAELWLRFLLVYGPGAISSSSEIVVNFRLHGASKTGTKQDGFFREKKNLYYNLLQSVENGSGEYLSRIFEDLRVRKCIDGIAPGRYPLPAVINRGRIARRILNILSYDIALSSTGRDLRSILNKWYGLKLAFKPGLLYLYVGSLMRG